MNSIDYVKKRIIISMCAILLLILTLVGITYAYFIAKVQGNSSDKSINITAANLELTYGDGNGYIEASKIKPGAVITSKTFTVENTGNKDIENYSVYLENVINELEDYGDLVYELTCSGTKKTCLGISSTFPKPTEKNQEFTLITNSIKVGEIQTYSLTLTYKETNLNQSKDMNKAIEAKVNIKDDTEYANSN